MLIGNGDPQPGALKRVEDRHVLGVRVPRLTRHDRGYTGEPSEVDKLTNRSSVTGAVVPAEFDEQTTRKQTRGSLQPLEGAVWSAPLE